MALVAATLENAWKNLSITFPTSFVEAADSISDAYNTYATPATANAIPAAIPPSAKLQFKNAIFTVLNSMPQWGADNLANAFATAVLSFWFSGGVTFGPGILTAFPGQPILISALKDIFTRDISIETIVQNRNISASLIANAFDVATKTITVTFPGPLIVTIQ